MVWMKADFDLFTDGKGRSRDASTIGRGTSSEESVERRRCYIGRVEERREEQQPIVNWYVLLTASPLPLGILSLPMYI
jgi:hypothetical protein